jgi:hypothetical protein
MAQAVSRWPLTAESRVSAQVDPCVICGGTEIGFSPSFTVYPVRIIPPLFSILIYHLGDKTVCPLVAAVQRRSLTPLKKM